MAEEKKQDVVVIDLGTYIIRAGVAGADGPSAKLSTLWKAQPPASVAALMGGFGTPMHDRALAKPKYFRALAKDGSVARWTTLEQLLKHLFTEELKIESAGKRVLIAVSALTPVDDLVKMAGLLFDKFGVAAVRFAVDAPLALSASSAGTKTALVVDVGALATRVVPVVDGHAQLDAVQSTGVGGETVLQYLRRLAQEKGFDMDDNVLVVEDTRHMLGLCFVAPDVAAAMASASDDLKREYELPAEKVVIDTERFRAPEVLFDPSVDSESSGTQSLAGAISAALAKCDKSAGSTVLLIGGASRFDGFPERLKSEMKADDVNVVAEESAKRTEVVWLGGSKLASELADSADAWIAKESFDSSTASNVIADMLKQ